jgi:hypothetical protein
MEPTTLAFVLSAQDDDSSMLGDETYRPADGEFHDWRFGLAGLPHPATCGSCGRKTDPDYVSPSFRVKHRRRDLVATYDGYTLASKRLRDFCIGRRCAGVSFERLPNDDGFFWLRPTRVIAFDAQARQTRFEKRCPGCGAFYDVVGATPARLRGVSEPLLEGFYRTDIEFGSGPEQHPLVLVGTRTAEALRTEKLSGLELQAVTTGP